MERCDEIKDLRLQVTYPIQVNGEPLCSYIADFVYLEGGDVIVEDVKGHKTDVYKLKKKLMRIVHGVSIRET